jgi:SAM-dependent methyltransferase
MMLGTRDTFTYLECGECGSLQLLDAPENMQQYYPPDYTAFRPNEPAGPPVLKHFRKALRRKRNKGLLERHGWLERFLVRRFDHLALKAFCRIGADKDDRILDVGCGAGILLADLKELGYKRILGVDRFIPLTEQHPSDAATIMRGGLEDLSGSVWDVIMFHHSFEHMAAPARVLESVYNLLAPGGRCLVRIPIVGWAWEHYGANWVQIDAPRHLFIYSEKSFRVLAESANFAINEVVYDSNEFQFWVSELYARDVDLASLGPEMAPTMFSKAELRRFRAHAERLNAEGRGDSAVFELSKR